MMMTKKVAGRAGQGTRRRNRQAQSLKKQGRRQRGAGRRPMAPTEKNKQNRRKRRSREEREEREKWTSRVRREKERRENWIGWASGQRHQKAASTCSSWKRPTLENSSFLLTTHCEKKRRRSTWKRTSAGRFSDRSTSVRPHGEAARSVENQPSPSSSCAVARCSGLKCSARRKNDFAGEPRDCQTAPWKPMVSA